MKIRCPKCSHVISLGIAKLPSTGIEIQCPSCSARFRLRSKEGDQSEQTPPPPAPTPAPTPAAPAPPRDIFGGSPQGLEDPFAPAEAAGSALTPPPPAAPAGGAGGAALDGLADLLQELDEMPAGGAGGNQVMYQVRGQRGNVFGPFDATTILGMLDNGQLTGAEELSPDGQSWHPMGDFAEFREKVAALQAAPPPAPAEPEDSMVSWEDGTPPAPAMTGGSPIADAPMATVEEPVEEEHEIRRIERKAPQRIRSALREDVAEAEGNRFSLSDLPALKESLQSLDRKWLIMGGGGLVLVLVLTITAVAFLSKPKAITYKDINIPLAGVFSQDSHALYKKVITKIKQMQNKQPSHPQLRAYRAISLAMYLEHYGPNKAMSAQLESAIKSLPKASPEHKPTALEHWAQAMYAIVKRRGAGAWKHAQDMKKKARGHFALAYLQAKAQELRRRFPQALALYNQAAAELPSPVRVHFSRGNLYLKQKKWEQAFQEFYKVTLISKGHYPAYLKLLGMEKRFPQQKSRYQRLWQSAEQVFAQVKSPSIKAQFLYKRSLRAYHRGESNEALRYVLAAIRMQPTNRIYQRKLPDIYLSTYDYAKTIFFLKKMMSRPGPLKPGVVATFLQVLFRIDKAKEARARVQTLLKRCPLCKKDHDFWVWRGRVEEASQLPALAIQSQDRALEIKPKSVAALAAKARNAWIANHPEITHNLLKQLEPLQPKTLLDRLNVAELYILLKRDIEDQDKQSTYKSAKPKVKAWLDTLRDWKGYEAAFQVLKPLLKTHPRDEYVNRLAGVLQIERKQYAEAEKLLMSALKTWGKDETSIRYLAISLDQQGKYKKAIPYYTKTIEFEPNKPDNYFRVGRLYYLTKKYKLSAGYLRKGLMLSEKNHEAHYYLGLAKEAMGIKDTATLVEHFGRAVSMAPNNREYLAKLARVYLKARQGKKALQLFTRLLLTKKLSPKEQAEVLLERGKLYYDMKLWRYALKDFQKLRRLEPKQSTAIRWIADCYSQMNRKSQAARWFKRALVAHRNNKPELPSTGIPTPEYKRWKTEMSSINGRLGDLYRSQNRLRPAIRYIQLAVRDNPENYSYHRQLGYLYKDLRKWSSCIRHFKIFLKKAPEKDLDRPEVARDLRACEDAKLGRY